VKEWPYLLKSTRYLPFETDLILKKLWERLINNSFKLSKSSRENSSMKSKIHSMYWIRRRTKMERTLMERQKPRIIIVLREMNLSEESHKQWLLTCYFLVYLNHQ
jgi:hypothetical protein